MKQLNPLVLAVGMATLLPSVVHAAPVQNRDDGFPALAPARGPAARPVTTADPRPGPHPAGEMARLEAILEHEAVDAERLCRAAHLALGLGLLSGDDGDMDGREQWLRRAEAYARRAAALRPDMAEPRYLIGAALGLRTAHEPMRSRLRLAAEIREQAEAVLLEDPAHPGALHLIGQLNAAAMRLDGFTRFLARTLFASEVLDGASWAKAEAAFRGALNAEPGNPAHRIELAVLLRDTGRTEEARAELRAIIEGPHTGPVGEHFRRRAIEALAGLR